MYCSLGQIVFQLEREHLFKNINFLSSVVFVCWCPFVTIFKCCNLQSHDTFFQVHKTASDIVPILSNKSCTSNIFERDYSNLNNTIPSKDINLWYIYKIYCREQRQHLMQQKRRTLLALHLKKVSYLGFFFLIQCQKSPLPPSVHFQ